MTLSEGSKPEVTGQTGNSTAPFSPDSPVSRALHKAGSVETGKIFPISSNGTRHAITSV
ncbi:MAG: hypothetical protein LUP97_05850 [Methanoregula sp.]|nr:hypothetical protein [Methanoregula sp.]